MPRSLVVLMLTLATGCFASHRRGGGDDAGPPPGREAGAADSGATDAGLADAGGDAGGLPCFCAGAAPCRGPTMCCPVTGTCEDPRAFRCTGDITLVCP